ncbi:MAG: gluconate 2-dehydrogenase subunit 3 family protein [Acetobacter aceti]|uniref:gluconate 2-dehydrogenase subunit 3 family protein n=1 Tax=Acetobacter aceti TaxID=435 RepID=UPI001656AF51|nr:gluconate 2-dehydrogenase subunit 3 family protein [Acetobacter aceti]
MSKFHSKIRSSTSAAFDPTFFSAEEWETLCAIVDRLIPADEHGPSATEAGVPEFLDRQMELPYGYGAWYYMEGPFHPEAEANFGYQQAYSPRQFYRLGLAGVDKVAVKQSGRIFAKLDGPAQDAILCQFESDDPAVAEWSTSAFFDMLLQNVHEGYFSDPMYGGNRDMAAWKMIGFPGARADFTDWIDRPGTPYPYDPVSLEGRSA